MVSATNKSRARWLLVVLISAAGLLACATSNDGSGDGPITDASATDAHDLDARSLVDDGGGDDSAAQADVTDLVDAAEAGIAVGSLQYSCPVHFSVGCVASDSCSSTCVGQFQGGPSCTWFAAGGAPNTVACTAVTSITAIFSCPTQLSMGCVDSSACESTCVGQYQASGTCSVSASGGVASNVTCTSEVGAGSLPLYQCPTTASVGCQNTSLCQTTCVGQISGSATCTWRGTGGAGTNVACTPLANQSF